MIYQKFKRCLSFALALLLAVSLMPVNALGAEAEETTTEETASTQPTETTTSETEIAEETQVPVEPEISDAALALQARIDALLGLYGIEDTMTDEEITNAIIQADGDTIYKTMTEREAIEADAMVLSMDELLTLDLALYERFWHFFDPIFNPIPAVTVTGVSGVEVTVDGNGSISESGGTVTVTVKGTFTSAKTTTITVKNTSGSTATISFDCTINKGSSTLNEGSNSVLLTPGATTTYTLTSKSWTTSTTATAKLSNFKVVAAAAESNVTVTYTNLGSVKMDGSAVNSGDVKTVSSSTGATFVATPTSGAKFIAWINPDNGALISESATYQLTPTEDTKIKAVFTNAASSPWFWCNGKSILLEGMAAALAHVASASNKVFTLASDATLPSGNYTIPAGVTLLIPYDSANTLCTTAPTVNKNAIVAPTAYRTLTMVSGANIVVNGGLSVAGSQDAAYPLNGQVTGPVGVIKMNEGSNITVNGGGALYAWGYVAGSGTVTIKSSGTVYEDFQVRDYRGGDVTNTLASGNNVKTWHIFPMSQYYVQNVQVPMKLEAGASEICYFSVTASLMGIKSEPVNFIGANSMFQITSGYIEKDYDESTDRLVIDVYGKMEVNPFSITIQVKDFGSEITINSANYDMPLNSNITINLNDSSVIELNQDLLMLPGSEINIGGSARLNVNDGKRLIVYDSDQWGLYCSDLKKDVVPLAYVFNGTKGAAPSYTRKTADLVDAKILVNGTLDAEKGYLYTTAGGGNICSSGNGQVIVQETPDATAYQIEQKRNNNDDFDSSTELDKHPIASAQLKNADGKNPVYTDTSGTAATYVYRNGIWCPHTDTSYTDSNNDHKCDTCGTVMSQCYDDAGDGDHSCDICGADGITEHTMLNGVCTDCGAAYEAQIGSTYYWTLAEAVSAASPGADISLLKNVETAVTVDKPLIILRSANKYTVNLSTADGLFLCTSDAAYAVTKGFTLRSAECSYEAEVVLRMKLYIPDVFLDGDYTIRLIKDGRFGKVETLYTMAELKAAGADKNGLYWAMAGVASGEMTCNVAIDIQDGSGNPVTIYQPNGNEVGDSFTYTVKQYVDGVLASGLSENHKAAANALAVYGGYAQQYFNVSPDKLAYEGLEMPDLNTVTADAVGHAVTYTGSEAGITVKSIEPFLDSATYLRLKFLITDGSDISNFTFTTTDAKGNSQTLKAFYEEESKRYCVDIPDIHAVYLDHTYTVTVTNNTTSKAHTVNASVLSWVNLAISKSTDTKQVNMAKALYLYNQAADTLFGE